MANLQIERQVGRNGKILKCSSSSNYSPDPEGLGAFYMKKMNEYSNKIAQIDAETGQTITHGEVLLESVRVAQNLQKMNIDSNDIITLCSFNNMECFFAFFAGLFLGNRISALDPTLPKNDFNQLLNKLNPRFIFCDEYCVENIVEVAKECGLNAIIVLYGKTQNPSCMSFSNFREPTGYENNFKVTPVKDLFETAFINFSSGSTGSAKAIEGSHYAMMVQQEALSKRADFSVSLYFSTFYWLSSTMILTASMFSGSARIVTKAFNEETALPIIEKYKVTYAIMAPIYVYKIMRKYKTTDFDTSNFNTLMIIGAKISPDELKKAKQFFPHTTVSCGYGMTEVSGFICNFSTERDKNIINHKLESCGRPIEGITYKIAHLNTGEPVDFNETGELRIKTKSLMKGYFNHSDPDAFKNSFDADGFLGTGDIVYYDKDYCFYIVDRLKNVIKYHNFAQTTSTLEAILLTHPDVMEAIVIGIPHPVDGDHATAFIVLEEKSAATVETILNYYNEKIMNYKAKQLHGGLYILKEIPKTPTGKPKPEELRNLLLNGRLRKN